MITYKIHEDDNCFLNVTKEENETYHFFYPCRNSTVCKPYNISLQRGTYRFELWGAQGGDGRIHNKPTLNTSTGGRGAYSSGTIDIRKSGTIFYLYIGGKGEDQTGTAQGAFGKGGYNGGGDGGADLCDLSEPESNAGGGGATDVRIKYNEDFSDILSLKSRIIVAAGGGSGCSSDHAWCNYSEEFDDDFLCKNRNEGVWNEYRGGAGGALHGYRLNSAVFPGNQASGSFGIGTNGISKGLFYNVNGSKVYGSSIGGGGGGYFGGTSLTDIPNITGDGYVHAGGAGGSSYVSGCDRCRSVSYLPEYGINTTDDNVHYSRLKFKDIKMMSGIENFTAPDGSQEKGHSGNGHITITFLHEIEPMTYFEKSYNSALISFTYIILVLSHKTNK